MRFSCLLFAIILFMSPAVYAETSNCPLTGLKNVAETIEMIGEDKADNPSGDAIKKKVQVRLIECGITVTQCSSSFSIMVITEKVTKEGLYTIVARGQLLEPGNTSRTGAAPYKLISWSYTAIETSDYFDLADTTTAVVEEIMDDFTNDYLKDNPPATPAAESTKTSANTDVIRHLTKSEPQSIV